MKLTSQDTAPSGGLVRVRLDISPTQTASGATALTTVTKNLKLKPGQTKAVTFKLASLPAALSQGSYYVVAELIDSASDMRTAASATTVSVTPPFVDMSGVFASSPLTLTDGRKAVAAITVSDLGNIPASHPLSIALFVRPVGTTGSADIPLPTVTQSLRLKPHQARTVKLKFVVPPALPAGVYTLVAQLDPANTFQDPDLSNNTAVGATPLKAG